MAASSVTSPPVRGDSEGDLVRRGDEALAIEVALSRRRFALGLGRKRSGVLPAPGLDLSLPASRLKRFGQLGARQGETSLDEATSGVGVPRHITSAPCS